MAETSSRFGRDDGAMIAPRDVTRGGVNRPAVPGEPPADGKISPLWINRPGRAPM
jgi:hypothetical protein